MATEFILTLSCTNRPGIVAAVSTYLFNRNMNIRDAQQFDDIETGRFFMRVVFNTVPGATAELADVHDGFNVVAKLFDMKWTLRSSDEKQRVLLMVSKFDHCLVDILYHWRIGELKMDVTGNRRQPSARDLQPYRFRRAGFPPFADHKGDQG